MKIIRSGLPTAGTPLAIVECLGESWYEKGLHVHDLAELIGARVQDISTHLANLTAQGLIQIKTADDKHVTYEITDRAKELLDDRPNQM